jgi:hypothetical protein
MTNDDLRKLVKAEPFRPFDLVLVNGRVVTIPQPDFIAVPTDRRSSLVPFVDPTDGLGSHFDPRLVVEVRYRDPDEPAEADGGTESDAA